jgi:hypothetical protein
MSLATSPFDLSPETMKFIVEEVVRRLAGELKPQVALVPLAMPVSAGAVPTAKSTGIASGTQIPKFAGAVLTLKDVLKLAGTPSRLAVSTRCVVTPSARDELRRLGIAIDRSCDKTAATALGTLVLVSDNCAAYEKGLSQALESRGFNLHRLFTTGADSRELLAISELAAKGFPALVATQSSAAWMLAAAQVQGLRPILAISPEYVTRCEAVRPNVLICDTVETPASKAATIALAFARGQLAQGGR